MVEKQKENCYIVLALVGYRRCALGACRYFFSLLPGGVGWADGCDYGKIGCIILDYGAEFVLTRELYRGFVP